MRTSEPTREIPVIPAAGGRGRRGTRIIASRLVEPGITATESSPGASVAPNVPPVKRPRGSRRRLADHAAAFPRDFGTHVPPEDQNQ